MDRQPKSRYFPPYTSIGGPYNEAYQNAKFVEAYEKEKAERETKEKKATKKDNGQEM